MPNKETKNEKAARLEVERLEGVVSRRENKVADSQLKLSGAKDRLAAIKKPKKATAKKKAKGKGARNKKKKDEVK